MRHFHRALLATAFAVTLPLAASAQQMNAEVLHWWTSGGESAAVKVFADKFTEAGGTWEDTAIAGGVAARTAGINRIVGGNPPTVMQFNTGKQFDELVANDLLRDMDAVAVAGKWRDVLPPAVAAAATRDGKFFAVPVNIHGQNWLFYNTKVMADAGIEPPTTYEEMLAAAPKLKAAGVIPLAQGGQGWQERLLFDSVLLAEGGPELFKAVYADKNVDAVKDPQFLKAADTYGQLRGLIDPGSPGRNWNDATGLVITGKAAMQVMGDWAKGEFIAAGLAPDKEYGCTVLPGGYVMGGDVFVFPKIDDPARQAAQDKMAELMLAPETQLAFNSKKGSVPVRLDVDVSGMDACAQKGMAELRDPTKQIPSTNFLASPDLIGATEDVITQYWNTPSMMADTFVEKFVGAMQAAG
ncbi:MAG: ABC transporter substrate-binding protein [Geminicoccaceae bacterium]